jgi:hypothetical protein
MTEKFNKTLLIGTILGAMTGLIASYLLLKRAEDEETELQITPKDGVKLGVGIIGLFRLITSLHD